MTPYSIVLIVVLILGVVVGLVCLHVLVDIHKEMMRIHDQMWNIESKLTRLSYVTEQRQTTPIEPARPSGSYL